MVARYDNHGSEWVTWKKASTKDAMRINSEWLVLRTHAVSGNLVDLTVRKNGNGSYFPKKDTLARRQLVSTLYRTEKGELETRESSVETMGTLTVQPSAKRLDSEGKVVTELTNSIYQFYSLNVNLVLNPGDCGTMAIDRGNKDFPILGFYVTHLYEREKGKSGFCAITDEMITEYKEKCKSCFATEFALGEFHSVTLGVEIPTTCIIPSHSPLNFG